MRKIFRKWRIFNQLKLGVRIVLVAIYKGPRRKSRIFGKRRGSCPNR